MENIYDSKVLPVSMTDSDCTVPKSIIVRGGLISIIRCRTSLQISDRGRRDFVRLLCHGQSPNSLERSKAIVDKDQKSCHRQIRRFRLRRKNKEIT